MAIADIAILPTLRTHLDWSPGSGRPRFSVTSRLSNSMICPG